MESPFSELLVVEQAPLLDEALEECRVAHQAAERLREELLRFGRHDLPAYEKWYHSEFGAILSLIREFTAAIRDRARRLEELRKRHWDRFFAEGYCATHEGGLAAEDEEDLEDDEEHGASGAGDEAAMDQDEDDAEEDGEDEDGEFGPGREDYRYDGASAAYHDDEEAAYYEEDEASARRFEERIRRGQRGYSGFYYYRRPRDDEDRARGGGERSRGGSTRVPNPGSGENAPGDESRIKDRYRALVKRLHPDLNAGLSAEERDLWHRVQAAYRERDLGKLDLLMALSGLFAAPGLASAASASLHELRMAARELQRMAEPLRREVDDASRQRAWAFSVRADRSALRHLIQAELLADLARLRLELSRLEDRIRSFGERAPSALRV